MRTRIGRRGALGVGAASLATLLWPGSAALGLPPLGVDFTFADLLLGHLRGEPARAALVKHPALLAIVRHRHMSGDSSAEAEGVLDSLLTSVDLDGAARVLEAWRGREGELIATASAASDLLPSGTALVGTAWFELGYDIGVAAPPDVLLNAAHPHFVADPSEVAFYLLHELHHVGFLTHRPMPDLTRLAEPGFLRSLIVFMTQLEGMAVHAAAAPRRAADRLQADGDYLLYTDPDEAARIVSEYGRIWDLAVTIGDRAPTGEELGAILGPMSSGGRLWYRFGALVAKSIEERDGRQALVRSIVEPTLWNTAAALLRGR